MIQTDNESVLRKKSSQPFFSDRPNFFQFRKKIVLVRAVGDGIPEPLRGLCGPVFLGGWDENILPAIGSLIAQVLRMLYIRPFKHC